jgi:hypothetical protein
MTMDEYFCKNYHGMQNPCDAGVDFKTVRTETRQGFDFPCFSKTIKGCSLAVYPTKEEIEEQEKEFKERFEKTMNASKLIMEATQGKRRVSGRIKCPACESGTLQYSVAYNGHVHADCSTPGCLRWVE